MFRVTHIPPLSLILDGLRTRTPAAIAKHLDISTATLARWIAADNAPRAAMLALFYESNAGYEELHTEAFNSARLANQLARSLTDENRHLKQRIDLLESLGTHGAANDPIQRPQWQPAPAAELYEGPYGRRVQIGEELPRQRWNAA